MYFRPELACAMRPRISDAAAFLAAAVADRVVRYFFGGGTKPTPKPRIKVFLRSCRVRAFYWLYHASM